MIVTPTRLLLLLLAALTAGLASLWLNQQGHWRNITWTPPAAIAPALQPPAKHLAVAGNTAPLLYTSIEDRPLFAPDRRPPPPPPPPAPPDPFAGLQLSGIFSGANGGILVRIDGKIRRVKINETIGDWTLKSIESRNITFTKGDQTRSLTLAYAKLNTVTPPAPTSPKASGATPSAAAPSETDAKAAYRENLIKRNEIRAARGLPLLPS